MKNPEPIPVSAILKSIQKIKQKVRKVGTVPIIFVNDFPNFSQFTVEYIELSNFKLNYQIVNEKPVLKKKKKK